MRLSLLQITGSKFPMHFFKEKRELSVCSALFSCRHDQQEWLRYNLRTCGLLTIQ